jgi:PBP1b-binding outer membrane lipoprotein LpoB
MKQILTILVAAALLSSCANGTNGSAETTDTTATANMVDSNTATAPTVVPTTTVTATDSVKH